MHVGILTLHLSLEGAHSLKDKRQVVRSLTQHLRNKFNASVAEVADLDVWRRATVGVAVVSNDPRFANQVLSQVVNHVEGDWRVVLDDYGMEIIAISRPGPAADGEPDALDVSDWFAAGP
jgi:uncharacterized protein YlxP (DUF503 family)